MNHTPVSTQRGQEKEFEGMIYKNVTIGKEKNVSVCEMGNGDVKVAACSIPDKRTAGVMLTNDSPKEIGTLHASAGTTSDMTGLDMLLEFSDEKSIDVVEAALKEARVILRNIHLMSDDPLGAKK